ncbi:transglutaminase [Lujinxingia vulgaris]|uniref:Transglutaminase n=1 Tax=Lujinxingia vulgaris TaxID=2600176 RepID=A0A5C6XRI5_9DELT|nr:transglutaminase family protein [Lujinxingia vulgaris]TXD41246.1 transglutaminase [Lujinxingia vulgaris]
MSTAPSFLERTAIADYDAANIQALVQERGWHALTTYERIGAAYTFVKDEIAFGYNRSDDLPASDVLAQGYGQCNTKGNLLLALMRALGIPCRFHGFTIDKDLQRGAIPEWMYPLASQRILHSWVEVFYQDEWLPLEGFILDDTYLRALQQRFASHQGAFCGYGAATPDLQAPEVEWQGRPTYIQREGIAEDFGVYTHPDELYAERGTNLKGIRRVLYATLFRHMMNARVEGIRRSAAR